MTKYFHISLFKQVDAAGRHAGGVEMFAAYLKRAVLGLELVSFPDMPGWRGCGEMKDYDKARALNAWLLDSGVVGQEDVVVVDGYWGLGLEEKVARLISVVHGSYYGRMTMHAISPWGEVVGIDEVLAQKEMWDHEQTEIVAVAGDSFREVTQLCGKDTWPRMHIVYHGVDLEVLYPDKDISRRHIMHAATSSRKGADIIQALGMMDIETEFMNEYSGTLKGKRKRLNEALLLLAPTRHEGNSYLLLEAMACGVPLLTYATGLALEMDERCGVVADDISPQSMRRLLKAFDPSEYDPRGWMEENAGLDRFMENWRKYLEAPG